MKLLLLLIIFAIINIPVAGVQEVTIADWLKGTWENKTMRGSMYERWEAGASRELNGKSFMLKTGDTIVFETIRIIKEGEQLVYIPTVTNQNQGLPVRFPSTLISEDQLVFENPQHDFPQRITYTRINRDSLIAEISGIKNGKTSKQTFPMKRIQ